MHLKIKWEYEDISCFFPVLQWSVLLPTTPQFGDPALTHQLPSGSQLCQVLCHLHGPAQALPSDNRPLLLNIVHRV